jgi:stage III sporulation protein AD
MEEFCKAAGVVLLTLIICTLLSSRDKSFAAVLLMGVSSMVLLLGFRMFSPVMDFLRQLEAIAGLQSDVMKILLKVTGIGILTEITVLLCTESGNGSLGQSLRTLSTAVILWMSLPVFQALLDLIRQILEGI